jgi:hypothetical protein
VLTASGSVLVQGAAAPLPQAAQRVRVLRAFLLGGQRQEVGSVVELPRALAAELLHRRCAERLPDAAPTPATTPTTATTAPAEPAPPPTLTTPRAPRRAQEPKDVA